GDPATTGRVAFRAPCPMSTSPFPGHSHTLTPRSLFRVVCRTRVLLPGVADARAAGCDPGTVPGRGPRGGSTGASSEPNPGPNGRQRRQPRDGTGGLDRNAPVAARPESAGLEVPVSLRL